MRFWTLGEIRDKILKDLDLEDESFVQSDELTGYINEAIDEAEAEIHEIHEDYFLSNAPITLVSGTDEYPFPSDVYGNKIRALVYKNGATVLKLRRLRDSRKLYDYSSNLTTSECSGNYEWFPINKVAGSPKVLFTPPVHESGPYVTCWYLRNANRLVNESDVCDIPEFVSFVIQYAKVRCYEKEGHQNLSKALYDLEMQRKQMNATLTGMVPDGENEIEADFSHYDEMT